jgi:hypothetical protein
VPSIALTTWNGLRREQLEQLYEAHAKLEGAGAGAKGRRYATQQLNDAIVGAVSAQFQGYCRALHDEASVALSEQVGSSLRGTFLLLLQQNRKLDHGNPNEGNLGADFWRLGLALWSQEALRSNRARAHREWLKKLNLWRNAVVHQDFEFKSEDLTLLGRAHPWLQDVRRCQLACQFIAETMDVVVRDFLTPLLSSGAPW